jgi:hypothetical protein
VAASASRSAFVGAPSDEGGKVSVVGSAGGAASPVEAASDGFAAGFFSGFGGFFYPWMKSQIIPRVPVPYFRSLLNLELYLTGCLDWVYALKRKVGMI